MNEPHPSHVLRFSWDASTFDYICENCHRTDEVPGGWGLLVEPCPCPKKSDESPEPTKESRS